MVKHLIQDVNVKNLVMSIIYSNTWYTKYGSQTL